MSWHREIAGAIVVSLLIAAAAWGADMNVPKCEKLCSPRGVRVYVASSGRCECEAFK